MLRSFPAVAGAIAVANTDAARWLVLCLVALAVHAPVQAGASESAQEAKTATVEAAKKTGHAAREAASAVGHAAKQAASEVAQGARKAYQKGKTVAKEVASDVASDVADKTRAVADKVKAAASE